MLVKPNYLVILPPTQHHSFLPPLLFMEETRIFCPVWYDCVLGACGLSWEDMQEGGGGVNSLALATATIARDRNTKASSIHYRISTILFHSGVKRDDLIPPPPPSPIFLSPSHWLGNLFTSPQLYTVFLIQEGSLINRWEYPLALPKSACTAG